MQYHSSDEPFSELLPQPEEMPGVGPIRSAARFRFDGDDPTSAEFSDDVDLVASLLIPQVVEARPCRRDGYLGAELGGDEGVE